MHDKTVKLKFIDSYRFLASSLDKLVSNLVGTNGLTCELCVKPGQVKEIDENYYAYYTQKIFAKTFLN